MIVYLFFVYPKCHGEKKKREKKRRGGSDARK
jgi:hypothetical protein